MEESKLIFSLDHREDGPIVSFSKEKPQATSDYTPGMDVNFGPDHNCPPPGLSHSPSFPGSFTDLAAFCEPLPTSLVKSSSSDLEPTDGSPPKGKPLLSLVKSLSTEISRKTEPEESLSKSDSKLHVHPQKQHQKIPETRPEDGGLCESDPPSTGSMSPTESKGSSLIADFEDTRRKFSEAMHDQLYVFSKMIGDDSPRQGRTMSTGDSPVSYTSDLKCRKKADSEHRGLFDTHVRNLNKKSLIKSSPPSEQHHHSEISAFKDKVQAEEHQTRTKAKRYRNHPHYQNILSISSLPLYWLLPVGLVAYGFFVLPLPPYVTGLSVGVASGFILGLIVVFMFAPRRTTKRSLRLNVTAVERKRLEEGILEGWMNETHSYDPETFQPSTTHSVYVSLEGSQLQLSYPSGNIRRWASLNETPPEATFLYSRVYQLADSKVSLLPLGLARKRIWNKKYPICIVLASEDVVGQQEGEETSETPVTLYLFGRTGRDKEEWFQHFLSVSKTGAKSCVNDEMNSASVCVGETVKDCCEELADSTGAMKTRTLLDYSGYMAQFIEAESHDAIPSPTDKEGPATSSVSEISNEDSTFEVQPGTETAAGLGAVCSTEGGPSWVNSLVGRIFWDFLREKYWTDLVAHKIQKKLSKIKLPYFMNELTLADLDMGTCLPHVVSTSKPTLDLRGLWIELEVMYTGCLQMTLETKMNLCKLGKDGEVQDESLQETLQFGSKPRLSILADSDEESSSAGSSEEEDVFEPQGSPGDKSTVVVVDGHSGNSTGRKILRFVDKIAKSKYFQKATENEYIKKKIAEVSNMPLMLSVEVQELSGTLAVNIPPPPTDRIWYSFQVPPRLDLHVRPMLGEREVTFTHVTEWIEKKLQCEFQKVFVMPNMDDIYLPLMTSGLESTPVSQHSSVPSSSQQSSMESQEYLSE